MKVDTEQRGWRMVLKDYEAAILDRLIKVPRVSPINSREAYDWLNSEEGMEAHGRRGARGRDAISRASVINSLNAMVSRGLLTRSEETGKGGHRGLYSLAYPHEALQMNVINEVLNALTESWPKATTRLGLHV